MYKWEEAGFAAAHTAAPHPTIKIHKIRQSERRNFVHVLR
ncbi:hypothetical protein CLOBOL_04745 [Enterocloster bolteae ATCC BAA-613]|uniref:Uncharacterized protein n=1 Tax=Enterocloster bolteae (strain ATCC BAA-613 / DSM 15670 / CCUG 46953 / JCM 12243 / WAL 16351) TaxID=411902 RepID=A8RWZ2_ENTBW|nr:hypothetical protein CLOBOL_04745 [Enterocloster bolteae ATCC BAA-613]